MSNTKTGCPGLFVSALRGGSGKTIITLGIIAALRSRDKRVAPFKKGPDYIDAGWLSLAAGQPCYNLDTYLIDDQSVVHSYLANSLGKDVDISVIEGNRGLFDGIDIEGRTSTAETAKLLKAPVVLCLDCTKSTRTMAAALLGCLHFDPELEIGGVILNRVAGERHKNNLINNIEYHTGVPVIGAVPKLRQNDFPERHMGLVPTPEHDWARKSLASALTMATDHINLDAIVEISRRAKTDLMQPAVNPGPGASVVSTPKPVIGVIKDSAFQFYYPENIEALQKEGAEIKFLSPLKDKAFSEVDALYIGGGFPETHAAELAANRAFRMGIRDGVENGLPVYAECGGLMYLGKEIVVEGTAYEMTGVFPVSFGVSAKPQGHGYVVAEVVADNPYFEKGTRIKGHEFRYSKIMEWDEAVSATAFYMQRGTGMKEKRDGICYKNALASYTHIHALGTPAWAPSLVARAKEHMKRKKR